MFCPARLVLLLIDPGSKGGFPPPHPKTPAAGSAFGLAPSAKYRPSSASRMEEPDKKAVVHAVENALGEGLNRLKYLSP